MAVPFLATAIGLAVLAGCLLWGISGTVKRDCETMSWTFAVVGHVAFLWASYTFVDCDLGFTRRLLSPMVPFLFFGLACIAERLPRFGRLVLPAVFVYLACFNMQRAVPFVRERFENGAGWWGKRWDCSRVVGKIAEISREKPVYSNASGPLVFRGLQNVCGIPWVELPTSGAENASFEQDYLTCISELASGRAVLGKVDFSVWCKRTVSCQRIVADAGLEKLAEYDDGSIFGKPGTWEIAPIEVENPIH